MNLMSSGRTLAVLLMLMVIIMLIMFQLTMLTLGLYHVHVHDNVVMLNESAAHTMQAGDCSTVDGSANVMGGVQGHQNNPGLDINVVTSGMRGENVSPGRQDTC